MSRESFFCFCFLKKGIHWIIIIIVTVVSRLMSVTRCNISSPLPSLLSSCSLVVLCPSIVTSTHKDATRSHMSLKHPCGCGFSFLSYSFETSLVLEEYLDDVPDICSNSVAVKPNTNYFLVSISCKHHFFLLVLLSFFFVFNFMILWFLVTRLLVHHTGEASSTIHTTSPYAYADSKTIKGMNTSTQRARLH